MKSIVPRWLFVYLFTLVSFHAFSLELNFKYYKAEEGLSSNTVYTALQDSRGFMWFGTENGLNRFDGYTFTVYRNIPRNEHSLVNNYVYCLAEDDEQTIWVGTERGVCMYNHTEDQFHPFNVQTGEGIRVSNRIQGLIIDHDKTWIASARQGVFLYEENHLSLYNFDEYKVTPGNFIWVTCIYKDREGVLWASVENTFHQVYRWDEDTREFTPSFPHISRQELKRLKSYSMLEDGFGRLWFGTWTDGLIAIDKEKGQIIGQYLNTPGKDQILHIHQVTEYDPETLLIGSNDGLTSFKISPATGNRIDQHFLEPHLSNRFVYPIYKDREGGLWIGTYYGGINYASPNRNYFSGYTHIKYENSISGNVVSCFAEDQWGNMWIGTEDGGLNELNVKTGIFHAYTQQGGDNSLSFDNVHALLNDRDCLWIGTYSGGLNVMNLETRKITHYFFDADDENSLDANNIYSIYRDSLQNIWVGTTAGINLYNREADNFSRMRHLNEIVMDITQWGNQLWFATINRGLQRYDLETGQWTEYLFEPENEYSLISNDVICLCTDESGQLWIGTNHGLCRYDAEQDRFIDEKVEFQSNYICKIFSENNDLWITTLKGLISYSPSTKEYRHFTKSDGLLSDLFTPNSGFKSSSGKIYLGTPDGFNAFYPMQMPKNIQIPPIEITGFQLFNHLADLNDHVSKDKSGEPVMTLAHNKNSFSFSFTALSYFAPEKNQYSFMLEGFDKAWNDAGKERKATYTNIPPGHYTFRIRATNNDGVWNTEGYSLPIVIKPPIWWNSWSISLYTVLFVAGIFLLFDYFRKKDRRESEEQIAKIRSEQEKESYRSKIEFFTSIAHEVRTPLSLIIAPLDQVIETSQEIPKATRDNLNIMRDNSHRLLTLVNQLLDFSKIEKGGISVSLSIQNIHRLLTEIYNRFIPFTEHRQLCLEYRCDDTDFETITDTENLTKAVSNLLSNASKHANSQIWLKLDSRSHNDWYEIAVLDDGNGMSQSEVEHVFKPFYQVADQKVSGTGLGLFLVKSIVEALEGKVKITSEPGQGFALSMLLPKKGGYCKEVPAGKEVTLTTRSSSSRSNDPALCPKNEKEQSLLIVEDEEKRSLLIVEDDTDMQSFIRKQFLDDYIVFTANDGQEGIAILENHPIDAIITDMMMPNMDGIEFCKTVKQSLLWNHIPIIMLTAKTHVNSKIEAFEIGADAYLEKPFHISYLIARVHNLLESREQLFQKFSRTPYASLKTIAGNKTDEEFLTRLNDIIEKNIGNGDFTVDDMAREMGISSSGLFAKIKQVADVTPNKMLQVMRLKRARELLSEGEYRVNEVCYMVGFNNPSYFTKCFQKQFGKLPKDFMNGDVTPL